LNTLLSLIPTVKATVKTKLLLVAAFFPVRGRRRQEAGSYHSCSKRKAARLDYTLRRPTKKWQVVYYTAT